MKCSRPDPSKSRGPGPANQELQRWPKLTALQLRQSWQDTQYRILEDFRRLRWTRYTIIRVRHRFFTVSQPRKNRHAHFYGEVKPLPRLHGPSMLGNHRLTAEALLRFRLNRGRYGQFNGIEIPPRYQRRGWAHDMVAALLAAFPDSQWRNGLLNDKSGPLFIKLHDERPDRIVKITILGNGNYEVAQWDDAP